MRFIASLDGLRPSSWDDAALVQGQRDLAAARHAIESAEALVAAEIARRSHRDLGHSGLAARHGVRSAEQLVQVLTGSSATDARRLVRVGALVQSRAVDEPWLAPALSLDVASLDVIRAGLGSPSSAVSADSLTAAASALADEAASLHVDALARRARQVRDELDVLSVGLREEERREQRYLRLTQLPSGMTRLSGLLDPESAAIVVGAVDAITAPRRGGPRFVEDDAPELPDDPRTVDQLMADALVDIVTVATRAPSGKLFRKKSPGVRVLVTVSDLASGTGPGHLEGQSAPVSIQTVERHLCVSGAIPLVFDEHGQGVDLGRDERLHQPGQRTLIAARDGACVMTGCTAPPGWCEVHHIIPWSEGGGTSVEDGVLLCRFHHLMMHNNGWLVQRTGAEYVIVPPVSYDPGRRPIPVTQRGPSVRRLLVQLAG